MKDAPVCDRPPDVPLAFVAGGSANLGNFCGQELSAVICP